MSSLAQETDWRYPLPQAANAQGHLERAPHRIYWHEYGNARGEPVLFVHGGPGGGSAPSDTRYFDPARYRIILFDQRGCGKSIPSAADDPRAALEDNTTAHLISDILALREHLGIAIPMHVFGGSWGSTLSLAYAIARPDTIATLILRGIFLCRRKDLDYFYQGNAAGYARDPFDTRLPGTYQFFPAAWKRFVEVIAPEERDDMVAAYARIFDRDAETHAEQERQNAAALAWSVWEGLTSFLTQDAAVLEHFAEPAFSRAFARIENHYFLNGAFFTGTGEAARDNNYLLEQVGKIAHLPIHIVQGQYDQVCPRFQADELALALERHKANVSFHVTAAGHSARERETALKLTEIMDGLPKL